MKQNTLSHATVADIGAVVSRPKKLIFAAAFASFVLSVSLFFSGDELRGIFVGLWVPSILAAGNLLMTGGDA
jgi:hypothetical protein